MRKQKNECGGVMVSLEKVEVVMHLDMDIFGWPLNQRQCQLLKTRMECAPKLPAPLFLAPRGSQGRPLTVKEAVGCQVQKRRPMAVDCRAKGRDDTEESRQTPHSSITGALLLAEGMNLGITSGSNTRLPR